MIAQVGDLNRVFAGQFSAHRQVPLLGIDVPFNPVKTRHRRRDPALREKLVEREGEGGNVAPEQRGIAGDVIHGNRIGPEAYRISLPEDAIAGADDGFVIRLPGDAQSWAEVPRIRPKEWRVDRTESS